MSVSDDKDDDVDLTNLNWITGAPVPLPTHFSLSPPKYKSPSRAVVQNRGSPFRECGPTSSTARSLASHPRPVEIVVTSPWKKIENVSLGTNQTNSLHCSCRDHETEYQKPNCSYTCLIGMALRASSGTDGCLPVNEIYKYVEKEFPYFKTAPDGWKNSVRHNLSLNPAFRKVTRNDGWQGKKGFFWEIAPEKIDSVNSEVDMFLKSIGRELQPHSTLLTSPIHPTMKRDKLSVPQQSTPCKAAKPMSKNTSPDINQYSHQIQSQIIASQMQLHPNLSLTEREFDTSNTPSEYVGIEAPPMELNDSARDLFGLDTTPISNKNQYPFEQCNSSGSSDSPIFPLYTPVTPYFGTPYGYPFPIASSSPVGLPSSPFLPQYFPPQYIQYVQNDTTGIIYGIPTVGNHTTFGMDYNPPVLSDRNGMEVEHSEKCSCEKCIKDFQRARCQKVNQKKIPSTPTSHYANGNGYVSKKLRLNNYCENNSTSEVHLTDTEKQDVDVDVVLQEFVKQSMDPGRSTHNNSFEEGATVTADGLSDNQRDQMVQITGVFDLENLLQSGINSFNVSSTSEVGTLDCLQTCLDNDTRPLAHKASNQNDNAIQGFQSELNCVSMMSSESPLGIKEITVETYRG